MNQFQIELFKGPYGAGKGTHGKLRVERLQSQGVQAEYLETSGLLRRLDDPRVREPMQKRQGVPLDVVCEVVENEIVAARDRGVQTLVLDGFPRYFPNLGLKQVECFGEIVRRLSLRVTVVRFRASLDFCNARIDQRIQEERLKGGVPRADDVELAVRVPALRAYFDTEMLVLRLLQRFGCGVKTISLQDTAETLESVARRLDRALDGRVIVPKHQITTWLNGADPEPETQIRSWFVPEDARASA